MEKKRPIAAVGDIVKEMLSDLSARRLNNDLSRVCSAWWGVCGEQTRPRTKVLSLNRGQLVIAVDSPPLCAELTQFRGHELREAMNKELGYEPPIKEVRFRLVGNLNERQ